MIPKYFRCDDPSHNCPCSVTREIIKVVKVDDVDQSCCSENPNCVEFREPVGWLNGVTGGRANLVYLSLAGLAALIILIMFLNSGNPALDQLKKLQARFVPLNTAVLDLGKNSLPASEGESASMRFSSLEKETASVIKEADEALASGKGSEITEALKKVDQQSSLTKHLLETIYQPPAGEAVVKAEAKGLLTKLQQLADESEAALEPLYTKSPESVPKYDDFIIEIKKSMGTARQFVAPKNANTANPESELLKKKIQARIDGLKELRRPLAAFKPRPELPFDPAEAKIRIAASNDLANDLVGSLVAAWSDAEILHGPDERIFLKSAKLGNILLTPCTAEEGFSKLAKGESDVFFADRAPSQSELKQFGPDYKSSRSVAEVVALDALTLLVNPVCKIDTYQINVGMPLRLASGPDGSTVKKLAEFYGFKSKDSLEIMGEQAALSDPNLLALSLYHLEGTNLRAKRLAVQSSPVSLALKPSPFTIATEDYHFSFRIVVWTAAKPSPDALSLVKFATSDKGQEIVAKQGYVDLRLRPMQGDVPPEILAALGSALGVDSVSSAIRLSTNFRFESGDADLDLKAQADIERLPRFMAESYPTHKVVILGFTDSDGGPNINMPLSKKRAETVAAELRRSKVDTRSGGMGDTFPIDNNETAAGKTRNRRAEIWVVKP